MAYEWDIFISHASEDKDGFVRPLAAELQRLGLKVWYDEYSLKFGDSLLVSINNGLAASRFGAVVFSHAFFEKKWTKAELNGLVSLEMSDGVTRILPIWRQITKDEMNAQLPTLAGNLAMLSSNGVEAVAREIFKTVRPGERAIDSSHQAASHAIEGLRQGFKATHPGYAIRIVGGTGTRGVKAEPGLLASCQVGDVRTDILVTDPAKLKADPPKITFTLAPSAGMKIKELLQSGHGQTLRSDEVHGFQTNLPFPTGTLPAAGAALQLKLIPRVPDNKAPVVLKFGHPPDQVTYSEMQLSADRIGTAEAAFSVSHPSVPFTFRAAVSADKQKPSTFEIEPHLEGRDFREVQRYLRALRSLATNGDVEIATLAADQPILSARVSGVSECPASFRSLADAVVEIEDYYRVPIYWPGAFTDTDFETLQLLLCAIRKAPLDATVRATVQHVKSGTAKENDEFLELLGSGEQNLRLDSDSGTRRLFGAVLDCGLLRLETKATFSAPVAALKADYIRAAPGRPMLLEICSTGPLSISFIENATDSEPCADMPPLV